ncbi:hypothetical protein DPMN_105882 [Dreissena polymorpha]|uniref:Uncharacterized protein n=1 Tax=Dreissena polymorpha TaxID=45954 RepID=A0A9D4QJ52_DREPO|nr:hypothetical protein DPMN_105882 [Dreissena polymorpha]
MALWQKAEIVDFPGCAVSKLCGSHTGLVAKVGSDQFCVVAEFCCSPVTTSTVVGCGP